MRGDSEEERRVEAIAISLEEQLSIVYPQGLQHFHFANSNGDGNGDEDNSIEKKEEAILRNSLENLKSGLPYTYPGDFKELKVAFTRAVQRWKAKNTQNDSNSSSNVGDQTSSKKNTTSVGSSFSLFDQLQGGGFALPVSLEEIQEASSPQERLKVFQKIKYLEDLLMDWNEICPLLIKDLSESSSLVDPELSLQIINLHRKWFDQGRSSGEYTPLLYGICQNLLETLSKTIIRIEEEPQEMMHDASENDGCPTLVLASLVQNWRDMWLDLMQRDQYSDDLAEEMEKCMFSLFLRTDDSSKNSCLAQKLLALVDPSARWFQSWTNNVLTNDHLISLLCSSCNERDTMMVLPELWIRTQTFPDNNNNGSNNLDDNATFLLHSIAIISIALCQTRVSQFPWEVITTKTTVPEDLKITRTTQMNSMNIDNFSTAIDEMLDLFLRAVVFVSQPDNDNDNNNDKNKNKNCSNDDLKITILNGVEAILAGSHNNSADFDRRYGKVTSSLEHQDITGDKIVARFLKIQLSHLR